MVQLTKLTKILIAVTVTIVVSVAIVVPLIIVLKDKKESDKNPENIFDPIKLKEDEISRIDCFLDAESQFEKLTQYACEKRGCIYKPDVSHPSVPKCFYDSQNLGYKLTEANQQQLEFSLKQHGKAPFPGVIDKIKFIVEYLGENIIHVKIFDPSKKRYEVPIELNKPQKLNDVSKALATFEYSNNQQTGLFEFRIIRKDDKLNLFDSSNGAFVFSEQFLQISTKLASKNIFGFGENNHESFKHDLNFKSWGMFARDNAPGWGNNKNNYGQHPFYMTLEESGKSHGVLILNSNAMEYSFTPLPSLTVRSIGGIFDLYFIIDNEPKGVIQNYHQLVGLPVLPPYWSFGFQICRWGYDNLTHLKTVVDRTKLAKIPHDVQYADIDYMIGYRDFTVDPILWNGMNDYFEKLQQDGMKIVLILDPFLVIERNYTPFVTGLEQDVYIKWPKYMAPAWPNEKVVYPDFFKSQTQKWWTDSIRDFMTNKTHGSVLDGLWIDMNEPSSFETNEIKPWNWLYPDNETERYPYFTLKCPRNRFDDPPYRTKNTWKFDDEYLLDKKARLSQKTICMISIQGEEEYLHYDVHSLYGYSQAIMTDKTMKDLTGKRPFVLSRSTFVGSGHYTTHWTGDNDATWEHLRMSIIGIFEFNMFGIPMVGADICGFFNDASTELCQRWLQLGAFYPFSRNHNAWKQKDKDPVAFNDESLIKSTVEALNIRYSILPYMYTLFYKSHTNGGAVALPLNFEFSADNQTWDIQEQFLLGSAFLVSPALYENQREVDAYFPPSAVWYDYRTGKLVNSGWQKLSSPLEYINIHVRGGYILPTQDPLGALNTKNSRKNPFGLLVTLNSNEFAQGDLFYDDGESFLDSKKYFYGNFTFNNDELTMTILDNNYGFENSAKIINTIKLYGSSKKFTSVTLNGVKIGKFSAGESFQSWSDLEITITKNFNLKFFI